MRQYITSFFLGIVIATVALIFQVFLDILWDLFSTTPHDLRYDTALPQYTITILIINSFTEEVFRAFFINKRIALFPGITHYMIHGTLLGLGFSLYELILYTMNATFSSWSIHMIIPVLLHISLSIFLFYGIVTYKKMIFHQSLFVICATIIHILCNIMIMHL